MRMLDNDHKTASQNVALYLTTDEARQLRDKLDWLIEHPSEHFHLDDVEHKREISASIYENELLHNPDRLSKYNRLEQQMFREA